MRRRAARRAAFYRGAQGDFAHLLAESEIPLLPLSQRISGGHFAESPQELTMAHGTTVIAVKFKDGVLNLADRRATSGTSLILYDEAEKVLALDDYTLIAIAGSYAQAIEAVRYLQHSFKYYARSQLQEMSLDGKLAEVSRVLSGSLPSVLQGIGGFLPVISAYDRKRQVGRIFFYDVMGARFETREFGAAGSGAERIRGTLEYIEQSRGPFHEMALDQALRETLLLLEIAAKLDAATGGLGRVLPLAKTVTGEGVIEIPEDKLRAIQEDVLSARRSD